MNGIADKANLTTVKADGSVIASTSFITGMLLATRRKGSKVKIASSGYWMN